MKATSLLVAAVLGLAVAGIAQAAPIVGTYQGPAMDNGRWSESFLGGGPSQVGNVINAASWDGSTLGAQWVLSGPALTSDMLVSDQILNGLEVQQYYTTYAGGTITLDNGPWTSGGDGAYTVNVTNFSQSTIVTLYKGTVLNVTGAISMQGTIQGYAGYEVNYLSATTSIAGAGAAAPAGYPVISGANGGQWGAATSVTMQIVPEPATLALLALGGMAMLRRRRK
jgi:hypothetical protein